VQVSHVFGGNSDGKKEVAIMNILTYRFVYEVKSDFMSLYKTTDQIVGHKGWQNVCAMKNVDKLLRATKTSVL